MNIYQRLFFTTKLSPYIPVVDIFCPFPISSNILIFPYTWESEVQKTLCDTCDGKDRAAAAPVIKMNARLPKKHSIT